MANVELTLHLHHVTDKAILVSDDGDRPKAVWLPLSQVQVLGDLNLNEAVEVSVPEWLATEKGLV